MDRPMPIVTCAVLQGNKILLLKRAKGDYVGLWALPGGKIELHEHISKAAEREVLEESGIESEFVSLLGVISEHLIEDKFITSHFLINFCEVKALTSRITTAPEGEVKWVSLNRIESMEKKMIPSDFLMIRNILKQKQGSYFDCVMEKKDDIHILKKFELIN